MTFHFINKNNSHWKKLDNAGKVFPSISNKRDTKVFRFACELTEEIKPDILQKALDKNLTQFPLYRCVLRAGFFWHYLRESNLKPVVRQEYEYPCSQKYDANKHTLLFEVTYYKKRINVEVYHALTDGTGALNFLRSLVRNYLIILYPDKFPDRPNINYDASLSQRAEDSFQKYYTKPSRMKPVNNKIYQLRGIKLPEGRIRVTEGVMSVKSVIACAKSYGVTVTVLLCSILLCAVNNEVPLKQKHRPVVVTVPVNLRNYFDSQSARNFFCTIEVGYCFYNNSGRLEDVMESVAESFRQQLTKENLTKIMNSFIKVEKNPFARIAPLPFKNFVLGIAGKINSRKHTVSLSNIGKVSMPEEFFPYIRLFDVFVSTEKTQICMCSFKDNMTVSFTSAFESTEVEKNFFRTLTSMGINVTVSTNRIYPLEKEEDI